MIKNVWAVGRNYTEHAKEMGNAIPRADAEPMFFLKAGSTIVTDGGTFHLPAFSEDVHHELEIALQFGGDFKFKAITVAIDVTARDTQSKLKSQGHPWTLAKSFRESCLIGPLAGLRSLKMDLQELEFSLKVNGEVRQSGSTRDMIHPIEKLRQYVLERFPVVEGDLVLTGTPAGVGSIKAGDRLEAAIPNLVRASWRAASTGA